MVLCCSTIAFAQKTFIHAGSMIDGVTKKMKTKQTIVIEGGVIVAVSYTHLTLPTKA